MSEWAPVNITVPRACAAIAPIGGAFARSPEDFVVEEVLSYEPGGEGQHLYCWIEKRGIPTREAIRRLARFLNLPTHDFGYAGLKDANAVTRQWISVEGVAPELLQGWTVNGVRVLRAERHRHKLRIGHVRANHFVMVIRDVPEADFPRAGAMLDWIQQKGLLNAYGSQRFGRGGDTFAAGLALIRGDLANFKKIIGSEAREIDRPLRSLMISAVQSEIFNRVLAARMDSYFMVQDGDVAILHKNGAAFIINDAAAEAPRCAAFEISPAGPILGTRLLEGFGAPREIEERVFAEFELRRDSFLQLPLRHEAHGSRRALRVPVADLIYHKNGSDLEISFSLPSGSYATRIATELLGETSTRN
ncbi:MAG: tRNA pseudouridine(13) synthase TruD [Planctomycetes bacterium]|nr:tRNA pseudouridine(13) synthase TruD [Planctomycetota bacterium]